MWFLGIIWNLAYIPIENIILSLLAVKQSNELIKPLHMVTSIYFPSSFLSNLMDVPIGTLMELLLSIANLSFVLLAIQEKRSNHPSCSFQTYYVLSLKIFYEIRNGLTCNANKENIIHHFVPHTHKFVLILVD